MVNDSPVEHLACHVNLSICLAPCQKETLPEALDADAHSFHPIKCETAYPNKCVSYFFISFSGSLLSLVTDFYESGKLSPCLSISA